MEINKYLEIFGGQTKEEMADGRMVYLTTSDEDGVYGVALPKSSDDAAKSKYCVTWTPSNQAAPYITPVPAYSFARRGGWDQVANDPFDAEVSYVYPGDRVDSTIPSGTLVRVFPEGSVLTVTSGNFVYSSSLAKGAPLSVSYDEGNYGKPKYDAAGTFMIVEDFDSDDMTLTFRIIQVVLR